MHSLTSTKKNDSHILNTLSVTDEKSFTCVILFYTTSLSVGSIFYFIDKETKTQRGYVTVVNSHNQQVVTQVVSL